MDDYRSIEQYKHKQNYTYFSCAKHFDKSQVKLMARIL